MSTSDTLNDAVDLLQQLGLKEYEARCFVGLSRLSTATAKQLSEVVDVPRTRIYDAVRELETEGLIEIQHSSPQRFRAVPLEEATETLRDRHGTRVERLHDALATVEVVDPDESSVQQAWAMAGRDPIENRTNGLIEEADREVVLVLGDESLLAEDLVATLDDVSNEVDLLVGALTEPLEKQIRSAVPDAKTFLSGLEWLHGENTTEDDTAIGRRSW